MWNFILRNRNVQNRNMGNMYSVEHEVTIYVEEVFVRLSSQEQTEFINERVDLASDEALEQELENRGYKVELV
jgi:hypothetical protein